MTAALSPRRHARARRLSKSRILVAVVVTAALAVGGVVGARAWWSSATTPVSDPWFAGYVDVTTTPTYAFETPTSDAARNVVLSFIVAKDGDDCTPSWGSFYTMDEAATSLDLDRRLARLKQQGGEPIVSFGGLANDELASTCTDQSSLVAAYQSVVDRYGITTIDLDIEGANLADTTASARRAEAIATVQANTKARGDDLAVWLTLPVAPTGLSEPGTNTVAAFLDAGVDLAGVNAMTMDYGSSRVDGQSMLAASKKALEQTHQQLGILYERADIDLTSGSLWAKIGATPMIGQNDTAGEVFTIADAKAFNKYAVAQGVGRMSMWSLNRDATCGSNYADTRRVSDSCSGVEQGDKSFATLLSAKLVGKPKLAATATTTDEPLPAEEADDPKSSPYGIWSSESTYLSGTKVVWHHNVYSAKWWTRGDLPDNPVLSAWETPWELVGPVLPGEHPVEPVLLPAGTYSEWTGTEAYPEGSRVVVDQYAFEAKWWNQGDSPVTASIDPDDSAWVRLTDAQVRAIVDATATTVVPAG
jgi:chitinase